MKTYVENFCEVLEEIAEMEEISDLPSFVTIYAIRDELARELPIQVIEKIIAVIKIKANQQFIDNKELFNRLIRAFCKFAVKIYDECMKEFNNEEIFFNIMSQFKFECCV